ncbi:MAG: hypothetical protein ACSHX9_14035 [Luteolibacter sp.]
MRTTCHTAIITAIFLSSLPLSAEVIQAPEQRFEPDPTALGGSPPIFEVGNLNVFKQFELGFDVEESIGAKTEIDLLLTTLEFGGAVDAFLGAHFGLEMGVCVGGSMDYDFGFAPTVVLPDLYPSEVKIPITISEGLMADSAFQTNFPSVPSMYADLILDIGAGVKAEACVFGCFTPIDLSFSTCDINIPDGDGGNLFKTSTRCDPFLDARAYCAVELLSLNRNENRKLRLLNVRADDFADFVDEPYLIEDFSVKDRTVAGGYGKLSINAPTVNTDSATSGQNTSQILRSSGAEDIIGVGIDLVNLFSDIFIPPNYPQIADNGSIGPIDWNYSLASLTVGPAIQLGMDFEMTWDLVVNEMTFTEPGTTSPKLVKLFTPPGSDFPIGDDPNNPPESVSKLSDYPGRGGVFTLTNCGPTAIPMVFLINEPEITDMLDPDFGKRPPVEVTITYGLKPKLKSVVSMPIVGKLHYDVLKAGAAIKRVGDIGFGPIIEGDHKFKFGEFEVYNGDPFEIPTTDMGEIKFVLQPAGPPAFDWNPTQWAGPPTNMYLWTANDSNGFTNWKELIGLSEINYPGSGGGTGSSVMIDVHPFTQLETSLTIDTLSLDGTGGLVVSQGAGPTELTVLGLLDNNKFIQLNPNSSLALESTDAVLCGPGSLFLYGGASLNQGSTSGPSTFCNYNGIFGAGRVMDNYTRNRNETMTHNAGIIRAGAGGFGATGSDQLILTLVFDNFPEETTWEVKDSGGSVIESGSGYAGLVGETVIETFTVPDGNHTFTINDSFGDGICCAQGNGSYELRDSRGALLASGGEFGGSESTPFTVAGGSYLRTAADRFVNEGELGASSGARLIVETDDLVNRIGSRIRTDGGRIDLRVPGAEHSGTVEALNGGHILIGPGPEDAVGTYNWRSGQSFRDDCGAFLVSSGGVIDLNRSNMMGACFFIGENGTLRSERGSFQGGVMEIGGIGVGGARMEINGSTGTQGFFRSCLNNFGTLRINGNADFFDSMLFANHGTIEVPAGGRLKITENTTTAPGAATTSEPGIANITEDTIMGGIWDVGGQMDIDGTDILFIGANATSASTSSGTVNTDGEKQYRNVLFGYYDLQLLDVNIANELPATGIAQMIVADVAGQLHVRIYNTNGILVMDKPESLLIPGPFLDELKALLAQLPFPTPSSLPDGERQQVIEMAAVVAGYGPESDSDPTAVLSQGNPAEITLRGTSWQWDSLGHLKENRGSLTLADEADFNPGVTANPGADPPVEGTDFTNIGTLRVNDGSTLTPRGKFIQTGENALTTLTGTGSITSAIKTYEICGGTVTATSTGRLFNTFGGELQSGNKVLVKSPITDDDVATDSLAAGVTVDIPDVITSIESEAEVTLHGASVNFPALTDNLTHNNGKFTVSGDGHDNPATLDIDHDFTNTGEFRIAGYRTRINCGGDYNQTGSQSQTRIGGGTSMKILGGLNLGGGEFVFELGSRPETGAFGTIIVNFSGIDFGNQLVIDFVDELAEDDGTVDIGDTWEIIPNSQSGGILGIKDASGNSTVQFRINGDPIATRPNWLPPNSHLEIRRYNDDTAETGDDRGLLVRVVPDNGFYNYDTWAQSEYPDLMPYQENPFRPGTNGAPNLANFLYGRNGGSKGVSFTTEPDGNGDPQRFDCFTFTRPLGTDANYNPYYSLDLVNWRRAAMVRTPGTPPVVNGELELVTMKAIYPSTEQRVFYRIQASTNPENFKTGTVPEKPITGRDRLKNYIAPGETSVVTPGTVLFFNVNAGNEFNGDVFGGTTSATDSSRNFIYQDNSRLPLAVLHAGLLGQGNSGVIKVTFIEPQEEFFASSHPFLNGGGNFTSKASVRRTGSDADTYSFKMELYEEP